mgnify:CR=1 FL=1
MKIANAPVSYGVFDLARDDTSLPGGEKLARMVHEAGYQGIDLGAPGLLGEGQDLTKLLHRNSLGLAGGWVDLPFGAGTDEEFLVAFESAKQMMPLFIAGAEASNLPAPKPTLADKGDERRRNAPGGAKELELEDWQWDRFSDRLEKVAGMVRSFGLEPTFHHHASTYVETPSEIDRFLEVGDVDITFDSGHLLVGGGEPTTDIRRWASRINHVHLKDADRSILRAAMNAQDPMREIWANRVFVPLGQGDLDVDAMMDAIMASGISTDADGWLVVEQDVILQNEADVERAQADQIANREALRRWIP